MVTALVAAVFAIVLLQAGVLQRTRKREAVTSNRRLAETMQRSGRFLVPALLLVAILLPALAGRYYLDLGVVVLTYVMLGWGLNIVVGLAGLLDLGYVAFYAVGAYSYALLSTQYGLGFWTCLPLAGIFAAIFGMLLGFPVLRLRGDYLAIVTLAFGEIIRIVINNWSSLTNGPNGISGIPRPTLFGLSFTASGDPDTFAGFFGLDYSPTQRVVYLYYVILALALLTNWVTLRLRRLPLGRAWEALREDEIACRSLGINVTATKLTAFAIGAAFGGFAGAFFATRQAFVSPESFTFIESAIVLAIVVLGGLGQPTRRRPRGHRHDRRPGAAARPARRHEQHAWLRMDRRRARRFRPVPHAHLRPGAGRDDGAAPARAGLRPQAIGLPRRNRRRSRPNWWRKAVAELPEVSRLSSSSRSAG